MGAEFERICQLGNLTPDAWMRQAVGAPDLGAAAARGDGQGRRGDAVRGRGAMTIERLTPGSDLQAYPPAERWDDWPRVRRQAVAAPRREAVHARAHDLLQLRGGLRPAGLRGQADDAGPEVRGQPAPPRLPRPQLRQGPGHHQPDQRPRADPLPAAAGGRARRGEVAARLLGRGPRRDRRPHPRGLPGGPPQRGDVPRRPAGPRADHGPRPQGLADRRPQLPHQRLLGLGPAGLRVVVGLRPAQPGPRQRALHPAPLLAPRGRATTSTRTPSGSSTASWRARSSRSWTRASPTPRPWPTTGCRPTRAARPRCCWPWPRSSSTRAWPTSSTSRRWTNWRQYMADAHPGAEPTFASFVTALKDHYRDFTPEFAEAESGVPRDKIVEVARLIGRARGAFASHVWRGHGQRQPRRLAGRARAAAPDRAHGQHGHAGRHRRPTPGTSTSRSSGRSRRARRSGTSCSSRRSGRSATTRCRSSSRTS